MKTIDVRIKGKPENMPCNIVGFLTAMLNPNVTVTELPTQDENSVSQERENIRREQSRLVMPLIGDLLDRWDELPNDVKGYEEWDRVAKVIVKIDCAMEGEGHITELTTQEGREKICYKCHKPMTTTPICCGCGLIPIIDSRPILPKKGEVEK